MMYRCDAGQLNSIQAFHSAIASSSPRAEPQWLDLRRGGNNWDLIIWLQRSYTSAMIKREDFRESSPADMGQLRLWWFAFDSSLGVKCGKIVPTTFYKFLDLKTCVDFLIFVWCAFLRSTTLMLPRQPDCTHNEITFCLRRWLYL